MTLIEAQKRIAAAAQDNPALGEAIIALVDTVAERVMEASAKDDPTLEGFDDGVMALAAAVEALVSAGAGKRQTK